jgi:hypothetical protein
MPITDIEEFFKFYDDMSDEEINAIFDEYKLDESSTETVYAEDYVKLMKAMNRVETISIDLAFLVLKSNNQIFSTVQIRSIYDIVRFECPVSDDSWNPIDGSSWLVYCDWQDNYSKDCEIQHLPQETQYFEIIYKTVDIDVNPF